MDPPCIDCIGFVKCMFCGGKNVLNLIVSRDFLINCFFLVYVTHLHCPNNNLNLCIKTEPIKDGTDMQAGVFWDKVGFLRECGNLIGTLGHDAAKFYAEI